MSVPYTSLNQISPKGHQTQPSNDDDIISYSQWAATHAQSAFRTEQTNDNDSFQLAPLNPSTTSTSSNTALIKSSYQPLPVKGGKSSATSPLQQLVSLWWWETAAAILATLSLVAIVLALRLHQNRPLPDWPYDISINSLVSIFVVFMKGSIAIILTSGIGQLKFDWFKKSAKPLSHLTAFDEASRGPLGALRLILTSRHRHLLATLGALVTLTATLIDPFTQQLLRFESCQRPSHKTSAKLPRAQFFDEDQGPEYASPGMIAAINTGLFYPGQYAYPFTCPTGNCTLPTSYYSVAFCSACTNMHDELQILTSPPEPYPMAGQQGTGPYTYSVWTNTTLPSGLTAPWNAVNGSSLLFLSAMTADDSDKLTIEMILSKGASPPIGREYGEFDDCPQNPQSTDWGCLGYGGSSCIVAPCIRVYSGDISAGNLTENTTSFIDSWSSTNINNTLYLSLVDMQCLDNNTRPQVLDLISANITQRDKQWLPIQVAVNPGTGTVQADPSAQNASEISRLIPKQCIYQITKGVSDNVLTYLGQYLHGNVSVSGKSIVFGKSDGTDILQYFYSAGKIKFDDVQKYFDSMTLSMTNYVRQNGDAANNNPVIGTVLDTMTCVHVRWPWIAYPVTVVSLTLCFIICLMVTVHQESKEEEEKNAAHLLPPGGQAPPSPQHDFKSSILPLLFHGFYDETSTVPSDLGHSNRVADLQNDAKQIRAQVVMTEKGWKFVARDRPKHD